MRRGPKLMDTCKAGHDLTKYRYIDPNGNSSGCILCRRSKNKEYYKRRYLESPDWQIRRKMKQCWGLTLEEYKELLNLQGNRCAICGTQDFGSRNAPIDHDHKTGKIRGILCQKCNRGLGLFLDNTEILKNAIRYLEDSKQRI